MLPEPRRAAPYIHNNVKHPAAYNPHKLALGEGPPLVMKSPHNAVGAPAFIVLDKVYGPHKGVKVSLVPAFHEISAAVSKNPWFKD